MKKIIQQILITFVIVSILCLLFWKIGWLTSMREAGVMLMITAVVIAVDLAVSFVWKKLLDQQ